MTIESLRRGRAAVITGAASGIGLATAAHLASLGMKVCMADNDGQKLALAAGRIKAFPGVAADSVLAVTTDVSQPDQVQRLKTCVTEAFGAPAFLMNNAAVGTKGGPWTDAAAWQGLLGVNLWGVINGLQSFVPDMIRCPEPSIIVNVGSKQGITTPPGNAAYAVAKAGVKVLTEQLAYELRQIDCRVTAHLLIPGFTFTGMTAAPAGAPAVKPAAAWTPEQVVDFLMQGLAARDFYILCPDNQVTREMDERRIRWAADDLIHGRPALSRWHPDHTAAFDAMMSQP